MKFLWCDTETTGLKPENAKPFQIAFIYVYSGVENNQKYKAESERLFYLNPFDIPGTEYSEEAGKVHGYSKADIETFDFSKIVVPRINEFLVDCCSFKEDEKMYFCGYNGKFDYDHIVELFNFYKLNFNQYFIGQLDVFDQVKRAGNKNVLPYLPNRKLTTIAEYLHIPLENAHDALGDIKATREVAKSLANKGIKLQ